MADVSKRDLRKFGLSVGAAFIVIGGISWGRGHTVAPRVLWALGLLLCVPGAVVPELLRPVQRWWMSFAAALGHVNSRILLAVFYYLIMTPTGLVLRVLRDPLNRNLNDGSASNWVRRAAKPVDPSSYEQQF